MCPCWRGATSLASQILVKKKNSNSYPTRAGVCSGHFSPVLLQSVTLAPLTFAELFNMDVYMFCKILGQVLIL